MTCKHCGNFIDNENALECPKCHHEPRTGEPLPHNTSSLALSK